MSKRAGLVLLIGLVLFGAGAMFYWTRAHRGGIYRPPKVTARPEGQGTPAKEPANTGSLPHAPDTGGPGVKKEDVAAETSLSPRPGETLEYAANVTQLNSTIANLKLVVGEKRNFAGKSAWHLQAFAHTENPYRMVFELDDQFDSYSNATDMASLQYEMHLNERGQKVDYVLRILTSPSEPAPTDATAARVLPGTRDPLGTLQYFREVDWSKTHTMSCPVYDGHKLYEVRAVFEGPVGTVKVPAGDYSASKIEIHVMENGTEMKDAHFWLYLANDAARTPVQMEAVLPFATAKVVLTKAK